MPVAEPIARSGVVDLVIAAVIFCAAAWWGTHAVVAFRASGGEPSFYQSEFGPAVMLACGRGLQNPDVRNVPALDAFLSQRTMTIDCAELPTDIRTAALDPFQRTCRYLELTVALAWKVTGVSWPRLAVLPGVLFGAVAALTYGMFRLGLSRALALLGMVPTLMSTPNLMLAPHLRDYAKGPFLLAVMLIMGVLVVCPATRRRVITQSVLGGLVVGIGLGFRTDLMIAVLPFVCALAFLGPRLTLRFRAAAIAAFLAAFALAAFPLLGDYSHGNNIGPVALLGLTEPFDQPLGIQPSIYSYGSQYNDSLVFSTVNSYAVRVENRHEGVDLASAEHAGASMAYLGAIVRRFPADFVARTLAAIRAVPRYFLDSSLTPPPWIRSDVVRVLYRISGSVSSRLAPIAVAAVVAATIGVSMSNPRGAWLIVVLMVGFAGAAAVQFHERHFSYLQFIPWWAFGLIVQTAARGPAGLRVVTRPHLKRAAVLSVILAVGVGGALLLTRAYQQRAAAQLFESYDAAPRIPLSIERRDLAPGRTLLAAREWLDSLPPDSPRIGTRFLGVQFRDDLCAPADLPLTLRYQAALPELDFSERQAVRLTGAASMPTVLFFAAFDRPDESSRFRGIELATEQSRCVSGIFRVDGLERTPLLLTTLLAANWRDGALYQRLR
jgi:hypothetical protein